MKPGSLVKDTRSNFKKIGFLSSILDNDWGVVYFGCDKYYIRLEFLEVIA